MRYNLTDVAKQSIDQSISYLLRHVSVWRHPATPAPWMLYSVNEPRASPARGYETLSRLIGNVWSRIDKPWHVYQTFHQASGNWIMIQITIPWLFLNICNWMNLRDHPLGNSFLFRRKTRLPFHYWTSGFRNRIYSPCRDAQLWHYL